MEPHVHEQGEARPPRRTVRARTVVVALVAVLVATAGAGLAAAKARVAARIGTGVVVINTTLAYGGGQGAASGMVLTSSGEVLTNNHVVRGASTIRIVLPGTGRSYSAKVVGYDISDDVAVLQAVGASNLRTVSTGNSAAVRVGQSVRAVGNAGGTGTLVTARGVVIGLGRAITVSDEQGGTASLAGLIETDAALQPGDSGGPLFSAAGKVIGMDAAASESGFQDIGMTDGYAIPIAKALGIARQIESGKATARVHVGGTAFLGVEVAANGYAGSGATIAVVLPGGPAAAAGLVRGDVITSFAGKRVSSPASLGALVASAKPGARVAVGYVDDTGAHAVTVTLGSGPAQ